MNNSNNQSNSSASAFLVGAAIGAVFALLLAPFSGRKMRRIAREKGHKAISDAQFHMNKLDENANKVTKRGQTYLDKFRERLKSKNHEMHKNASTEIQETANKADVINQNIEEDLDKKF